MILIGFALGLIAYHANRDNCPTCAILITLAAVALWLLQIAPT